VQSVLRGFVKEFEPGRRVCSNRVDAEAGHQTEVFGDTLDRGKLIAVRIGCERAVRHTFDEESFAADLQKLAVGNDSRGIRKRSARTHVR
jgi:hypothetical protein